MRIRIASRTALGQPPRRGCGNAPIATVAPPARAAHRRPDLVFASTIYLDEFQRREAELRAYLRFLGAVARQRPKARLFHVLLLADIPDVSPAQDLFYTFAGLYLPWLTGWEAVAAALTIPVSTLLLRNRLRNDWRRAGIDPAPAPGWSWRAYFSGLWSAVPMAAVGPLVLLRSIHAIRHGHVGAAGAYWFAWSLASLLPFGAAFEGADIKWPVQADMDAFDHGIVTGLALSTGLAITLLALRRRTLSALDAFFL
jgi:hypothetical protein